MASYCVLFVQGPRVFSYFSIARPFVSFMYRTCLHIAWWFAFHLYCLVCVSIYMWRILREQSFEHLEGNISMEVEDKLGNIIKDQ